MKHLLFIAVILTLGLYSATYAQNLQMGTFDASMSKSGWTLDKGTGERSYDIEIIFEKPYDSRPEVIVSVNALDAATDKNVRFSAKPKAVTRDGFLITVVTWSDSRIYGLNGSWFAFNK